MKREIERGSLLNDRRKVDGELEEDRLIVWTFVKTTFYKGMIAMQFEKNGRNQRTNRS